MSMSQIYHLSVACYIISIPPHHQYHVIHEPLNISECCFFSDFVIRYLNLLKLPISCITHVRKTDHILGVKTSLFISSSYHLHKCQTFSSTTLMSMSYSKWVPHNARQIIAILLTAISEILTRALHKCIFDVFNTSKNG